MLKNEWKVIGTVIRSDSKEQAAKDGKPGRLFVNVVIETVGAEVTLDLYGRGQEELAKYPIGSTVEVNGRPRVSFDNIVMSVTSSRIVAAQSAGSGAQGAAGQKAA